MSFEYVNDQSQETMQGLITTEGMLFQDEFVKKFFLKNGNSCLKPVHNIIKSQSTNFSPL